MGSGGDKMNELMKILAKDACDAIELKELLAFYYDSQIDYMESLSKNELIEYAYQYGNFEEGEVEEMMEVE